MLNEVSEIEINNGRMSKRNEECFEEVLNKRRKRKPKKNKKNDKLSREKSKSKRMAGQEYMGYSRKGNNVTKINREIKE